MTPEWTLRRRVTALGLLVVAVLMLLATGAIATAVANRQQVDELLEQIVPMRTASDELLAAMLDQEAGVRGFLGHGDAQDLVRYQEGLQAQRRESAAIRANPLATPQIRSELDRLDALAQQWQTSVAGPALTAARLGDAAAAESYLNDAARSLFDQIRATVVAIQQAVQQVRDRALASIEGTGSTLVFVVVSAVLLVIGSVAALLIAMQRAVIGPVTGLAAQVRAVAGGDYAQPIAVVGPPELERLARDIDAMRQKITSDLAEVDAARRQIEHANALLEQQAAELTRSNRDLEQFAYVASHDLQEPLRKVTSFCQLLQRRYADRLDERANEYIALAVKAAQRMQRLINDLLAFSRIGQATTGFGEVDLDAVVAEVVRQLDASDRSGAEITWSGLPVVRGEEALLFTLFGNLIGNSVKFRHGSRWCRVHLTARRAWEFWEISCVDNGIGISKEFAEKVFMIFQRLHPADAYPGTGIGLAIAKKIVGYHGGRIWIDTDHRDGTATRFTLPAVAPPGGAPAAADRGPASVGRSPGSMDARGGPIDPGSDAVAGQASLHAVSSPVPTGSTLATLRAGRQPDEEVHRRKPTEPTGW